MCIRDRYTLREESAPYGYKVASDVTFEVKETAEIQKVSMKDEQAVGKIVIEKTDKVTGKPIEGVVFEVRDKDGNVLDTLTTDKNLSLIHIFIGITHTYIFVYISQIYIKIRVLIHRYFLHIRKEYLYESNYYCCYNFKLSFLFCMCKSVSGI